MAPARYEYGPSSVKPTSPTRIDGAHGPAAEGMWPISMRQTAQPDMPATTRMLRPFGPSLSLRKPPSSTEIPPHNGNSALWLAAALDESPTNCTKYVGIQRLKVSRKSVAPNASTQTIQKGKLVSSGFKIAPMFTRSSSPDVPPFAPSSRAYPFLGFTSGLGRPRSSGDSRSSSIHITIRTASAPDAKKNTPRQPTPCAISSLIIHRQPASPNRKLRLTTAITLP